MANWDDLFIYESGALLDREAVMKFAYLTSDLNTIHIIDGDAQALGFERSICHGMLVAAFISPALTDCFGEGTVYVDQHVKFIKPVLVDSYILVRLQNPVVNAKGRIELQTNVAIENVKRRGGVNHKTYELALIGEAEIIPGKKNYEVQKGSVST